jgi:hypothetical protein
MLLIYRKLEPGLMKGDEKLPIMMFDEMELAQYLV